MYRCSWLVAFFGLLLISAQTVSAQEAGKATRVSPGGTTRVYVMAAFDTACQPLTAPKIDITALPQKGKVSFREGQSITVQQSAAGTCIGQKVPGTGIYYTANEQASGPDTFSISARLSTGETTTRTFQLIIQE